MNTFRIENNEIQIYFDNIPPVEIRNQMKKINFRWDPASKVWHAPFSDERQRLALELASPDFPEDLPMQPKNEHETLINYIDSLLSSDNEEETGYINSLLLDKVPSELDTFVQAIRAYKDEENQASSDKKQQESSIKQTIDEIVARKKHAEKRRKLLESIIKEYILSTGESELRGDKFNVSFIKTSSFSISKELEEDIRRRADIPNWINIEVKINLNNFKKLKEVPQGVIESHGYKLQSWTKEEGDPNKKSYEISLEQFLEGKSIKEIAKERNLKKLFKIY